MSARRLFTLCTAGFLVSLAACGSEDVECGSGTREQNGQCVATGSGNDNGNGTATSCGAGTELVGNECIATATLAGFAVTATPVDCDAIVDGVVPVATTVTAVDDAGETLEGFSGDVALVGLGGVTVSPSTVSLSDGTGTVTVTLSGTSQNAEIVAFDASGAFSGRSPILNVVPEEVLVASITAPSTTVRSGETFNVSVALETNACRPPTDPSGSIVLSTEGGGIV
ncbi:MAG: hypothetical protein AAFQ82_20300, partial [Myxococcota bacterium]